MYAGNLQTVWGFLLTRTHIKHMLLNLHFIWKPTGQSVSSYMCKLGSNQNVYEKLQKHICLVYLP